MLFGLPVLGTQVTTNMAYIKREGGSRGGARGGKSGGFKSRGSFGGGQGGFGGDRGPVELFEATCAECSKPTQVPFRPNGKKPVYCRDCFKRQEGMDERSYSKPSFGEKRSYDAAPKAAPQRDTRIDEINTKLDRVIRFLEELKADVE